MPKQKKSKGIEQAPEMLLWEIPFEFISPLSLDECSSRLQEINVNKSFFHLEELFFYHPLSHKRYYFISQNQGADWLTVGR